ncbi:DUF2515 family protein [Acinetobacter sp. yr461]|uniref:DUF2515 family protein n=1 Tax=Acinetobacter sp. yr461 TaxID=1761742 RepID=UPI0008D39675|nr:hypothetical protein [Acinetobacter sp. yr461]SEO77731.1 hypothetical protein SAMN04487817_11538 [Acinetobacter sp. yr461]
MSNSLDWNSKTNISEHSCKDAHCDCLTFWEIYQQEAIKRLSNLQKANNYKLEPGYEARARRIASVYAKIFLEIEHGGNKNLLGRYYWMGLGAFASKTVATIFKHWGSLLGYNVGVQEAINLFARGNLWLFMDIAPWHLAWSASSESFKSCKGTRDTSTFKFVKPALMNLPWSSCLPSIKNLKVTKEINDAFTLLPAIEKAFLNGGDEKSKYRKASQNLFDHLMAIAVQEQHNILQVVVWENTSVKFGAWMQRWFIGMPDATLVLSSDYSVDAVKKNWFGNYTGSKADQLVELKEDVYIAPLKHTIAEDYDSRMKWIGKAAEKYHRLMLDEKGRPFLQQELKTISKWGNSKADFKIHSSSNEGKV